jgi:hypothetical protein
MRRLTLAAMAALTALVASPTAEARRIDGDYVRRLHPVTDYGYQVRQHSKARHASRGHHKSRYGSAKHSKRYASRRSGRRSYGGARASRSCLTQQARTLLGRIEARFGHVQVISTCRPGARIATTGKISKHASGQAIDFRAPGKKRQVVQWLIANHHSGGTMTYSDMDHIHVDVGYHFVALNRPSGRT